MLIEHLIEPVSTFAGDIDFLFELIFWIVGIWFVLSEGMFFWLIWRFRYREGVAPLYVSGTELNLKRWITWPHAIIILLDLVIIYGAVTVWYMIKQDLPASDHVVRVIRRTSSTISVSRCSDSSRTRSPAARSRAGSRPRKPVNTTSSAPRSAASVTV
jgi:hypothetical protein